MFWKYLTAFLIGVIVGMFFEDRTSTDITYKGKIKQKGRNNSLSIKKTPDERQSKREQRKTKKRRLFRRKKDKT